MLQFKIIMILCPRQQSEQRTTEATHLARSGNIVCGRKNKGGGQDENGVMAAKGMGWTDVAKASIYKCASAPRMDGPEDAQGGLISLSSSSLAVGWSCVCFMWVHPFLSGTIICGNEYKMVHNPSNEDDYG